MRSLATSMILFLMISLISARPCACEMRERLAAGEQVPVEDEGHDCCCCGPVEPEVELTGVPSCSACAEAGHERGAVPRCGGQVEQDAIVEREGQLEELLLPAKPSPPRVASVPRARRVEAPDISPVTQPAVLSTVMRC